MRRALALRLGPCPPSRQFEGEATFYRFADGSGRCSFDRSPKDLLIGAINRRQYAGAAACGACVRVIGPQGAVTVRIVDECPTCRSGDLDLSPVAFERLAPRGQGRVPIRWSTVPCTVIGPIRFRFKKGSNQWWAAVQVLNHRHPVTNLELLESGGRFAALPRMGYNYFVRSSGMGLGPYTFRVTDVHGSVVVSPDLQLRNGQELRGSAQFPGCTP
jgi:expansin (peptidoglycan-binding protein)